MSIMQILVRTRFNHYPSWLYTAIISPPGYQFPTASTFPIVINSVVDKQPIYALAAAQQLLESLGYVLVSKPADSYVCTYTYQHMETQHSVALTTTFALRVYGTSFFLTSDIVLPGMTLTIYNDIAFIKIKWEYFHV